MGDIMGALIGIISVVGFFVCGIKMIIEMFKKTGNDKKWKMGSTICIIGVVAAVIMLADSTPKQSDYTNSVPTKTAEQIAKENEEASAKAKAEAEAKKLPLVNLSGAVTPNIAQKGEKVIIKVDIENLDDTKPIDGIRMLFSNNDFLEDGLIIVNVMSGGVQDGRAFNWKNDAAVIPPKGKRSYQIVAQANTPGTYESTIQIKSSAMGNVYADPQGNEELIAKLVVLN